MSALIRCCRAIAIAIGSVLMLLGSAAIGFGLAFGLLVLLTLLVG